MGWGVKMQGENETKTSMYALIYSVKFLKFQISVSKKGQDNSRILERTDRSFLGGLSRSRALRNIQRPRAQTNRPAGGGEGGRTTLTISHVASHNPLLALRLSCPKRRRLIRRGLKPEPTNLLLRPVSRDQSRRVGWSPRHSRGPRRRRLLLHVDHRRTIVHIRGDEIRVLPHLGISVTINEGNG
jgi:hypothetical protein